MDVADFADNLVYDERTDICFAFDPRDETKRRLNEIECDELQCFDCAYTAGKCIWDPNFLECQEPPLSGLEDLKGLRWW